MCLFTYVFHACGHSTYTFAAPTQSTCSSTNTCPTPSLDNDGEDLIAFSKVLHSSCSLCTPLLSTSNNSNDPYLTSLRGIADVLELELTTLDYGKKEAWKAMEAVKLLSRMAAVYDVCRESKPDREEVRGWVVKAVEKVDAARTSTPTSPSSTANVEEKEIRHATPAATPAPERATSERSPTPPISITLNKLISSSSSPSAPSTPSSTLTNPYSDFFNSSSLPSETDFSEGTVKRQLQMYSPPNPTSKAIPIPAPIHPVSAVQVEDMMRDMRLSPSLYFRPKSQRIRGTDDGESVITNPVEEKVGEKEKEGRDAWACDFCGPVCLCERFDD
ncbi:hypothetical protein BDV96DRAFT_649786 [Lophiotrema nucula]|uniref:Uncharacterized protein n=1 Tax=Lophiotrema nucula TaxID=690887 RepID=A0A6A5Z0F0_9PLEO|nr:hypothetical protein BDV96DRAFT_649786 [Lophiotrema nucula]